MRDGLNRSRYFFFSVHENTTVEKLSLETKIVNLKVYVKFRDMSLKEKYCVLYHGVVFFLFDKPCFCQWIINTSGVIF